MREILRRGGRALAVSGSLLLLCGLLLAGCGTTSSGTSGGSESPTATTAPTATPTGPQVMVSGGATAYSVVAFGFDPKQLTVKVGQTVVWSNGSGSPHTVTSDTGTPDAFNGSLPDGGTFSFTFTKPGTYTYHCNFHPSMHGTVVVTP